MGSHHHHTRCVSLHTYAPLLRYHDDGDVDEEEEYIFDAVEQYGYIGRFKASKGICLRPAAQRQQQPNEMWTDLDLEPGGVDRGRTNP
jgi:hypothetical protein